MNAHFFVDIHCHPSIKAFARSFRNNPGIQSMSPKEKTSIWYRDAPSMFDKVKQYIAGLTNFIQSDANSLVKGNVCVVCLSFYPQEKGFFNNKLGSDILSDTLTKLATEFGQERINHLQSMESYWEDLKMEMNFLSQGEHKTVKIDGKNISYSIARSYREIQQAEESGSLGDTKVIFIPTIEGGHVFDQVMDSEEAWNTHYADGIPSEKLRLALSRISELRAEKDGLLRPAFITLAHHFWNGICGQARSLGGIVKCVIDQENGLDEGITIAGRKIIAALLDDRKEGDTDLKPIIIDIKHMSRRSRIEYFELLEKNYPERNIPIIVSHGGVTGLSKPGGQNETSAAQEGLFMTDSINFYDDEILRIDLSQGLFGIQLDERRIGSRAAIRSTGTNLARRTILYKWAKLVFNQIRHIAEVLDAKGRFAWGIQCLGTDFDGIIDPINGYWTAAELDNLDDYLLMHAFDYLKGNKHPCPLTQDRNKTISPEEIVERFMTSNALNLLSRIL